MAGNPTPTLARDDPRLVELLDKGARFALSSLEAAELRRLAAAAGLRLQWFRYDLTPGGPIEQVN